MKIIVETIEIISVVLAILLWIAFFAIGNFLLFVVALLNAYLFYYIHKHMFKTFGEEK